MTCNLEKGELGKRTPSTLFPDFFTVTEADMVISGVPVWEKMLSSTRFISPEFLLLLCFSLTQSHIRGKISGANSFPVGKKCAVCKGLNSGQGGMFGESNLTADVSFVLELNLLIKSNFCIHFPKVMVCAHF